VGLFLSLVCLANAAAQEDAVQSNPEAAQALPSPTALFDGKSLDGWRPTEFGGQREVAVVDGTIQLDAGEPLTGITFEGPVPTDNYELSLQARKLKGGDFFCAPTFPVGDSHCTLVLGGWGGTTVGLSCLDGHDASENETTQFIKFEPNRWYSIRIRVAEQKIQCWLDDKQIIDASSRDRKISLRNEVLLSRPLGICSFATKAQLREIKLARLDESQPADKK
jgi:hypothetical protein